MPRFGQLASFRTFGSAFVVTPSGVILEHTTSRRRELALFGAVDLSRWPKLASFCAIGLWAGSPTGSPASHLTLETPPKLGSFCTIVPRLSPVWPRPIRQYSGMGILPMIRSHGQDARATGRLANWVRFARSAPPGPSRPAKLASFCTIGSAGRPRPARQGRKLGSFCTFRSAGARSKGRRATGPLGGAGQIGFVSHVCPVSHAPVASSRLASPEIGFVSQICPATRVPPALPGIGFVLHAFPRSGPRRPGGWAELGLFRINGRPQPGKTW